MCISVGIIHWTDGGVMEVIYVLTVLAPSLRVVQTCWHVLFSTHQLRNNQKTQFCFLSFITLFFSATLPPFSLFVSTAEPRTRTLLWTRGFINGTKCPQLTSWVLKFAFDNLIFNCRGPLRVCVVDMLRQCWGWGTASVMFDGTFYLFHWIQERERILALFSSYAPCCHSPIATFWRLFDGRGSRETAKQGASLRISKLATMKGPICALCSLHINQKDPLGKQYYFKSKQCRSAQWDLCVWPLRGDKRQRAARFLHAEAEETKTSSQRLIASRPCRLWMPVRQLSARRGGAMMMVMNPRQMNYRWARWLKSAPALTTHWSTVRPGSLVPTRRETRDWRQCSAWTVF